MGVPLLRYGKFEAWFRELPVGDAAELAGSLEYLSEHGRSATLPYARHRIQMSKHFPDMSEIRHDVRIPDGRRALRVLTCFVDEDRRILICLGGDKHRWEQRNRTDWYEEYVPAADRIVDFYIAKGDKR